MNDYSLYVNIAYIITAFSLIFLALVTIKNFFVLKSKIKNEK